MQGLPRSTGARTRSLAIGLMTAGLVFAMTFPAVVSARSGARLSTTERRIVGLVNNVRRHYGLPHLRVSHALNRAADRHSADMERAGFFDHPSSGGTPAATRIRGFRHSRSVGENLAYLPRGSRNAAYTVVQMWMNSAAHRAVLLSPSYRRIGVAARSARIDGGRGTVYTADFTSRR